MANRNTQLPCVLTLIVLAGCSDPPVGEQLMLTLSGVASVGSPIRQAVVTISSVETDGTIGKSLSDTKTGEAGEWSVTIPQGTGAAIACVAGGDFLDPATSVPVQRGSSAMCAFVPSLRKSTSSIAISAWSQLAWTLATFRAADRGLTISQAHTTAVQDLDAYLSCAQPRSVTLAVPGNPTVDTQRDLSPALLNGLLHAGLSSQAALISERLHYTPGVRFTAMTLLEALTQDLAGDGVFNGIGANGKIVVEGYALTSDSLRSAPDGFPQGLRRFIESSRNATGVQVADVIDLLNCLATHNGVLFTNSAGGGLDITPPVVTFITPADHAVISGPAPVSAVAVDASEITGFEFEPTQSFLLERKCEKANGNTTANLTATLDTTSLKGEVTISIHALDAVGNAVTATRVVVVDKDAPEIIAISPAPNAKISGTVLIDVEASDPNGVSSLKLLAPEIETTVSDKRTKLTAKWDTTKQFDRATSIEIEATDVLNNSSRLSVPVVVDNYANGTISGCVALETPVLGANIEAIAFANRVRERIVGKSTVNEDGCYSVVVADDYSGPVLLRAFGTTARYTSAATGAAVSFTTADELTSIVDYHPSAAGTLIDDAAINGLTTLASYLATKLQGSSNEAIAHAFELFGGHLNLTDPIDIRFTRAADMGSNAAGFEPDATQRIGLFHVGLARWGAEVVTAEGLTLTVLPTTALLRRLIADLDNRVLDGKDSTGAVVWATSAQKSKLTTNTLRYELSGAIKRWLDSTQLSPAIPCTNPTGLKSSAFDGPNGFLWGMSGNTSELFGVDGPIAFDQMGPQVATTLPTSPVIPPAYRGTFSVSAQAADPSGILFMHAEMDGAPEGAVGPDQVIAMEQGMWSIDTTKLADGVHHVKITAADSIGNKTETVVTFIADNSPPVFTASAPTYVKAMPVMVSGTYADATGITSIEVRENDRILESSRATGSYSMPVNFDCNKLTNLRVIATDALGNRTERNIEVRCDSLPPSLTLTTSSFYQEKDAQLALDNGRVIYNPPASSVQLAQAQWPIVIKKYFNRLDYIPNVAEPNIPIIKFVSSDPSSTSYTAQADLVVEYRYSRQDTVLRDWTRLPYPGDGQSYSIPIAYQTLSPSLSTSTADQQHVIDVRITDIAGNQMSRSFPFTLELLSPPVWISGCGISDNLKAYNLQNKMFHNLFGSSTVFTSGTIQYELDLPPGSLAPQTSPLVTIPMSPFERVELSFRNVKTVVPVTLPSGGPTIEWWDCSTAPACEVKCDKELGNVDSHIILPEYNGHCRPNHYDEIGGGWPFTNLMGGWVVTNGAGVPDVRTSAGVSIGPDASGARAIPLDQRLGFNYLFAGSILAKWNSNTGSIAYAQTWEIGTANGATHYMLSTPYGAIPETQAYDFRRVKSGRSWRSEFRRFRLQRYVDGVSILMNHAMPTAVHPTLPVAVSVVRDASCQASRYETTDP